MAKSKKRKKSKSVKIWAGVITVIAVLIGISVPVSKIIRIHLITNRMEEREKAQATKTDMFGKPIVEKPKIAEWTRLDEPTGLFTVWFPPGGTAPPKKSDDDRRGATEAWYYYVQERQFAASVGTLPAGQENRSHPDNIAKRIHAGRFAAAAGTLSSDFDYVVMNREGRLGDCAAELLAILDAERAKAADATQP